MPQFDPAMWSPQIVWLIIAFVTLYWLMKKRLLPRIESVLQEREERISSNLNRAEELRTKAENARVAYEASLEEARTSALATSRQAREELSAMASEQHAKLGQKLAKQIDTAEARVEAAKNAAINELRAMAVETTGTACSRLLGEEVEASVVAASVDATMKEAK